MVSPLEVSQGAEPNDPLNQSTTGRPSAVNRRGKREQVSRPQSHSLVDANHVLAIPFVLIVMVVQAVYLVMKQLLGDPGSVFRDFLSMNREADKILSEIPVEQNQQRVQLEHVHEQQIDQKQKLEVLQRRVHALEERRAARENARLADMKISSDGLEIKSEWYPSLKMIASSHVWTPTSLGSHMFCN